MNKSNYYDNIFLTTDLKTFCEEKNMTMTGVRLAIDDNRKYKGWIVNKEKI